MGVCRHCGAMNQDHDALCRSCSSPLDSLAPDVGVPRGHWKKTTVVIVVTACLAFVAAAVVTVAMIVGTGGTKTFTNSQTGLSFSYPAAWKTIRPATEGEQGASPDAELARAFSEAYLVSESPVKQYILGVGAMPGNGAELTGERWDNLKNVAVVGTRKSVENLRQKGETVNEPTVTELKVDGRDVICVTYAYTREGVRVTEGSAIVNEGTARYMFSYTNMVRGGQPDTATFREVLDSVRFDRKAPGLFILLP